MQIFLNGYLNHVSDLIFLNSCNYHVEVKSVLHIVRFIRCLPSGIAKTFSFFA